MEEIFGAGEEKFKQLIKNSFDMIVLLDSDGNQKYVSESCEKILGYKQDELVNIPVIDTMLHPEDREKVLKGFNEILNYSNNGGVQYRHRHKNGGWVYLEAFGTNQTSNPHINYVVLNVRDVSERKKAEDALKESEKQLKELNATKDRFFSIIAHDLRSPFNSIVGLCNLLEKQIEEKDYKTLDKYVNIIQDSSKKAMDLLINLLEWSQAQTGRLEFNPEYFELVDLIKQECSLLKDYANQKTITLDFLLPSDMLVYADKEMISSVVRNLVSNAIKFTDTGGNIRIFVENKEREIMVFVEDNGVGINPENMDKLFKLEDNYSTIGTKRESGTGLGLLLCKEFIDMHSGKIWVQSEEGKGSKFFFTIPNQSKF